MLSLSLAKKNQTTLLINLNLLYNSKKQKKNKSNRTFRTTSINTTTSHNSSSKC